MCGKCEYRTMSADTIDERNKGRLVHIVGEMRSREAVMDEQFDVRLDGNCVRLRTQAELYQVIEHRRKTAGGSRRDMVIVYCYTREWSSTLHDTSCYHDAGYRRPVVRGPIDMMPGDVVRESKHVELGSAYVLAPALVRQCNHFELATHRLRNPIKLNGTNAFTKGPDSLFYHRPNTGCWAGTGAPQLGDCRVQFEYVPDGIVTALALQDDCADVVACRGSLLPYRLTSPAGLCCGVRAKADAGALVREGRKTTAELAENANCQCFPWICCCICNLVEYACSSVLTPEIYHIFEGNHDTNECFGKIEAEGQQLITTWVVRLCGWASLFAGLRLLFAPLSTLRVIIPFLGLFLQSCGNFVVSIFSFLVTLVISVAIVLVAWLVYHPIVALRYSVFVGVVVVALFSVNRGLQYS